MKKIILSLIVILLLGGCQSVKTAQEEAKIKVVVTSFSVYDWVRNIIGDEVELVLLMDGAADLHNYQPTMEDMVIISEADLFIYIGGTSDDWVTDTLSTVGKEVHTLNLMAALGDEVKVEEVVEGMEDEHGEEEHADEELDEHIWLSLRYAQKSVDIIVDELNLINPEMKSQYEENKQKYIEQLIQLDTRYQDMVATSTMQTMIVGDRFPFRYLLDDYGISYYAAFSGCSAETEASFETVVFLANKVDELEISKIVILENSTGDIATVVKETTENKNQEIIQLNSLQSVTKEMIAQGVTYLSVMEENLNSLKEILR
ncbi:MAG: metal ABC transporter substrate-binding protein [Anaerorhabdus sp.]